MNRADANKVRRRMGRGTELRRLSPYPRQIWGSKYKFLKLHRVSERNIPCFPDRFNDDSVIFRFARLSRFQLERAPDDVSKRLWIAGRGKRSAWAYLRIAFFLLLSATAISNITNLSSITLLKCADSHHLVLATCPHMETNYVNRHSGWCNSIFDTVFDRAERIPTLTCRTTLIN